LAAAFDTKPQEVTMKEYQRLSRKTYSGFEMRPLLKIVNKKTSPAKKKYPTKSVNFDSFF